MIHTERIDIIVQEHGARTVQRSIENIGESANRSNGMLSRWLTTLRENIALFTAAAGAAAVGLAAIGFGFFEHEMAGVRAASNATDAEFRLLNQTARSLGLSMRVGAIGVAQAEDELVRAGITAEQVSQGAARAALTMAQATGGTVEMGANVASNAMIIFNQRADQLQATVQGAAAVINLTTYDLNDYRHALANAGLVAQAVGVSFADFNAILASTAGGFSSGADHGTALKTFLLRLTPTTREATRAFRDLGLNFRDAEGHLRPLDQVLDHLHDRLSRLNDAQRSDAIQTLFGVDAYRVAVNAYNAGGDRLRYYRDQLIPATDATAQAAVRTQGLYGAMMNVWAVLQELAISSMDGGFGHMLAEGVNALANGLLWVAQNLDSLSSLLIGFAAGGAVLLVSWLTSATGAIVILRGAFASLFSLIMAHPLALAAVAVGYLVSEVWRLRDTLLISRDGVTTLGDWFEVTFAWMANDIARPMMEWFADEWNAMTWQAGDRLEHNVGDRWKDTWDEMLSNASQNLSLVIGLVNGFVRASGAAFSRLGREWRALWSRNPRSADGSESWGAEMSREFRMGVDEMTMLNGGVVNSLYQQAQRRAERRREAERAARGNAPTAPGWNPPGPDPTAPDAFSSVAPHRGSRGTTRADVMERMNREIDNNTRLLRLNTHEREIQQRLDQLEEQLIQGDHARMTAQERTDLETRLRLLQDQTRLQEARDRIWQQSIGVMEEMRIRQQALNDALTAGTITQENFNTQMRQLRIEMLQMRIEQGNGSFADGFLLQLNRMLEGVEQFRARAGQAFGDFFSTMSQGFADSVGRAIAFGDDLGESLMNVARNAVAQLISALVQLGIQWLINATLGNSIAAASTAANAALAVTTAAAWAPAAAAASLASFGANAGPAMAGMTATYGLSKTMAFLRDGGLVSGPGGPRGDRVPAMLSDGEFVVNASAARRHMSLLRSINAGASAGSAAMQGGTNSRNSTAPLVIQNHTEMHIHGADPKQAEEAARQAAREFERLVEGVMAKHQRPGGMLANKGKVMSS